jgi:alkylation response protein AidB-like acyl-CoA dehydrogenase
VDFLDSPEEAAFRGEARAWLVANAAEYRSPPREPYSEAEFVARARDWLRRKSEVGLSAILWPEAFGGRGGTPIQQMIFEEEEGHYYVPNGPLANLGMRLAGPTILQHGDEDQIRRFATPTLRGEIAWCQLFSEPAAGSDLAALRTRAVRDGDNWVVNGQKVWSSWAHHADWGILLARTDASLPKHKGLTFFLLDMKAPGIEVRPIRQMSGKSDFNETFLTDVVIPDSDRLGEVNGGWGVAMFTLTNERLGGAAASTSLNARAVYQAARETGALDDMAVRERIARWLTIEDGLKNLRYRLLTKVSKGESAGPMAALAKLMAYRKLQELSAFAMDLKGYAGLFEQADDVANSLILEDYIWSSAMRLAGGSDEILRNQLAERILKLPREARADKDVPFSQLP